MKRIDYNIILKEAWKTEPKNFLIVEDMAGAVTAAPANGGDVTSVKDLKIRRAMLIIPDELNLTVIMANIFDGRVFYFLCMLRENDNVIINPLSVSETTAVELCPWGQNLPAWVSYFQAKTMVRHQYDEARA